MFRHDLEPGLCTNAMSFSLLDFFFKKIDSNLNDA